MLELVCRGRPALIEPMVFRLAMRLGLVTGSVTGWPASDHYRILRLARRSEGEGSGSPLAVIELQEIPNERTVITLGPAGELLPEVERYAQALAQELARFEFLMPPDVPKAPIGFQLDDEDRLAGARLLETFDAINSVEIGPAATPGSKPDPAPAPDPATS